MSRVWAVDIHVLIFLNSFAAEAKRQLLKAGFEQLNEEQEWAVQPGGRYFFTRNMSSIFAFAIGQK
jgi:aspartyl aminopeptidase